MLEWPAGLDPEDHGIRKELGEILVCYFSETESKARRDFS